MSTLFKLVTKLGKLQKQFNSFVTMKMKKQAIASLLKMLGVEKMIESIEKTEILNPHRQSVIIPTDYEYVGIRFSKLSELYSLEDTFYTKKTTLWSQNKFDIECHMENSKGKFYDDNEGALCHCDICGTHLKVYGVYYHQKTNSYIRVGETCMSKLDNNQIEKFRFQFDTLKRQKGYPKAFELLRQNNLEVAIDYFLNIENDPSFWLHEQDDPNYKRTDPSWMKFILVPQCNYLDNQATWLKEKLIKIYDLIRSVAKNGKISESQVEYIKNILDSIERINKKIESEKSELTGTPFEGRGEVSGQIISTKIYSNPDSNEYKMLILDDRKFKVWITIPANIVREYEGKIDSLKGLNITLSCTLKSTKDKGFAYGSRPSKAEVF